jgi:hypothetical protein
MIISGIILKALKKIIGVLEKENIDYCLFGGLAMQVYKRIRATKDIDLMVSIVSQRIPEFIHQIEKAGFNFDKKKGIIKLNNFELLRFIYTDEDTNFEIFIDLVSATTEFQKQILNRKTKADFLGIMVNIASPEDLVLLKILADRPIDFVDALDLCKENKEIIDKNYLKGWAKRLGVGKKLKELLKENA